MQAAMDRLQRLVARRRRLVLGIWIVLLTAAIPFASRQTEHLTGGGFENQASGSHAVATALQDIPGARAETLAVVFDNRRHDPRALAAALDRVQRDGFQGVDGVRLNPRALAAARVSSAPVVVMALDVTASRDAAVDDAAKLRLNLGLDDQDGAAVPVHLVGQGALWAGMQELSKRDLEQAELVGLPIVLLVLLVVFGSLAAAALPLALGAAAVLVTGAIVYFLSRSLEMSIFVTNIASMLGIGVAVDYSLFILARYREELHRGLAPDAARAAAMRTSGMAVAFSGVTVIVALAGLFLVDANVVRSMAVGAIVVVAVAVLAAVTLLPALIALLGRRLSEPGRVVGRLRRSREPSDFWKRWTAALMKRPLPFAIGATALMLVIASPALSLRLDNGAINQFPKDFETRVGFDLANTTSGPGAQGPIQLVADFGRRPVDTEALHAFAVDLKPRVAGISTKLARHKALLI